MMIFDRKPSTLFAALKVMCSKLGDKEPGCPFTQLREPCHNVYIQYNDRYMVLYSSQQIRILAAQKEVGGRCTIDWHYSGNE